MDFGVTGMKEADTFLSKQAKAKIALNPQNIEKLDHFSSPT
jgi:hypothetical protein